MLHFFIAYTFDLVYNFGPPGPVLITGTAAIIDGKIHNFSSNTILGWRKFNIGTQEPTKAL